MPIPPTTPVPGDVQEGVLRAGLAHTACTLLVDAAQHVARTAMPVEAATAVALQQSLIPGGDKSWVQALDAAEQALRTATNQFVLTSTAAIDLVRDGNRQTALAALASAAPVASGGGKAGGKEGGG